MIARTGLAFASAINVHAWIYDTFDLRLAATAAMMRQASLLVLQIGWAGA